MTEPGDALLEMIRRKIAANHLPRQDCDVTWYGPGRGRPCAACDRSIMPTEVEVECDLSDGSTVRLHRPCYDVWRRVWPTVAPA
jgi:hypothetical protein